MGWMFGVVDGLVFTCQLPRCGSIGGRAVIRAKMIAESDYSWVGYNFVGHH